VTIATGAHPVLAYPAALGPHVTRMLEAGQGDRNVILLHGAGSRADRWRRTLSSLADAGYHVFAPDLPGHGFAPKGAGLDYRTPAVAAAVADLLERLGGAALVGTSLGAHVATWVAGLRPSLVPATVLVGATGMVPRPAASTSAASAISDLSEAGVRRKLELLLHDPSLADDGWVAEEQRINSSPGAVEAMTAVQAYLQGEMANDLTGERYAATGIPTLLVWGAQDRWVPLEVGRRIAALLPRAPFVVLEAAGHAPYLERASVFTAVVNELLSAPERMAHGMRHL
jgi:2-hydroxy-6-oxonona-2,4-dienedioate hydrolase